MRRAVGVVLAGLVLGLPGVLAGCSEEADRRPPEPAPADLAEALPTDRFLTVAAFNVLGGSHTAPGGGREEWPSGVARVPGVVERLEAVRPDVVGFQELQHGQTRPLRRALGRDWAFFADQDNAVAWRRSRFEVVDRTTLTIPYFRGKPREMPVVRLRLRDSGEVVTVVSVHNPADDFGDAASDRAEAIRRERALVERERAAGRAVLLLGDLNAEREAFCPLTRGGLMTAANGGSHRGGTCTLPEDAGIDWILGAGVAFDGYLADHSPYGEQVSDHPMLVASVASLEGAGGG